MTLNNLFFALSFFFVTQMASANPTVWIELGPEGQPIARAIVSEAICPELRVDDKVALMAVRAPSHRDFDVTVCEAMIPRDAQSVSIAGQGLSMPKKEIERIVLFGDTGCILTPAGMQECLDLNKWPFKKIADQAAALAPDLVIHLGDYWYREMPCLFKKGCEGSPYGNNWDAWNADFFTPAEKLLKAAPWIFIRGNHENCYRGGFGWFRFLDPNPYTDTCQTHTALYRVPMGETTLFVMDSSEAQDAFAPSILVEAFKEDFKKIKDSGLSNVWLLTHKPLWDMDVHYGTQTLKIAAEGEWPSAIKWLFAGHVHNFEVLNVSQGPTQFIVGTGGGLLQSQKSKTLDPLIQGIEDRHFGFLLLTKKKGIWEGDFYDTEGVIRDHCSFKGNDSQFSCHAAAFEVLESVEQRETLQGATPPLPKGVYKRAH